MKINNKSKSNTRKILLIFIIILICASIIFTALELFGVTRVINKPIVGNSGQTGTNTNTNNTDTKSNPDINSSPLPDATSNDISLSTRRENNGNLTILTKLINYGDGTCELLIKNEADSYKQSAPVIYQSDYSTCEGFNIASNVIPSGTWEITLSVTSKGITNKQTTSVEVQ